MLATARYLVASVGVIAAAYAVALIVLTAVAAVKRRHGVDQ